MVGFDDIPVAAFTHPGLTTVRQPLKHMGQIAAKKMCIRDRRKIYPGVWDVVKFKRILIELDSLGIGKFKETQLSQFPQRESGEVAVGLGNGLGIAAFASGGGFLDATIECGLGRSNVRRIFRRRFLWGDGL